MTELPPLSLSIIGIEPLDSFVLQIADFIHNKIMTRREGSGKIEVEAKIGILKDKRDQKIEMPIRSTTTKVLDPDRSECKFESDMTPAQHKYINQLLNNLQEKSSRQQGNSASAIRSKHLHLIDSFYTESRGEKVRVSRDEKTKEVVECVCKERLGNLNIYNPNPNHADWRVTVNVEREVQVPQGIPVNARKKNRMSYAHEEFVIDLTQVTSISAPGAPPQMFHELELEIARPDLLLATASWRNDPQVSEIKQHAFDELIRAFVNNARILSRNVISGRAPQ